MASFSGVTFKERGSGSGQGFPVWSMAGNIALKKVAGSATTVIQITGVKLPRLSLPVRVTAAQLTDLRAAVGTSDTIIFHFETTTAILESITDVEEFYHGLDKYTATLNLIRSSSFASPTLTHTPVVQYNHSTIDDGTGMTDITSALIGFTTHHDKDAECGTCELTLASYPSGIVVNDHFVITIDGTTRFNGRLARPAIQYYDHWTFYLEDIGANLRFKWGGEGTDPELDALFDRVYTNTTDDAYIVNIFEALGGPVSLHSIPTTLNPLGVIYPLTHRVGQPGWTYIRGDSGIDVIYGMWTGTTNDGVLRRGPLAVGTADFTATEGTNILLGSSRSPLGTESIINRYIVYGLEYEGATIGGVGVGDYSLPNSNIPTPPTSHTETIRNNLIEDDATALACATIQVGLHNFPYDETNLILLGDPSITIGQTAEINSTGAALSLDHNADLRFVASVEDHFGVDVGYETHVKAIRTE